MTRRVPFVGRHRRSCAARDCGGRGLPDDGACDCRLVRGVAGPVADALAHLLRRAAGGSAWRAPSVDGTAGQALDVVSDCEAAMDGQW